MTQPIDELLGLRDVREILRKMSSAVGWKGTRVPFDFTGFSGYWPDITPDGVDICHGQEVIGTFFPKEDGALGFEANGEELAWTRDFSPWEVLEDFQKRFPKSELKESVDWLVENIKSDGKLADDLMKKIEAEE